MDLSIPQLATNLLLNLERLEIRIDLGDRVALHKIGPLRVNGLRRWRAGGKSQVQRQVGHIKRPPVEAESGTRWEQQPLRYAVFIDAIEVAQLGKNLSGGI